MAEHLTRNLKSFQILPLPEGESEEYIHKLAFSTYV